MEVGRRLICSDLQRRGVSRRNTTWRFVISRSSVQSRSSAPIESYTYVCKLSEPCPPGANRGRKGTPLEGHAAAGLAVGPRPSHRSRGPPSSRSKRTRLKAGGAAVPPRSQTQAAPARDGTSRRSLTRRRTCLMQGSPYPTPPSWVEADSIRETTLYLFDHRKDRTALRRVGRLLHDLALEATRDPVDESSTRTELRAAAADLRYTSGYLFNVIRRSAEWCSLDESDEKLARFAGKIGRQVDALVEKIERRLS